MAPPMQNNQKQKNLTRSHSALIIAILLTVIALYGYRYIPEKHLVVATANQKLDLYSTPLANGELAGSWIDKDQLSFRCSYPKGFVDSSYYCSVNRGFALSETKGIDLSGYNRIKVKIHYEGTAPKLRLFARTFDPGYSKPNDPNSTKYNAVFLPASDLGKEITIDIKEFAVTEWWLLMYEIPRKYSHADLSNVVVMGIDFSYPMTEGNHDVTIEKIEFIGERIAKDKWYLGLFSIWLAGIFLYSLNQLRMLKQQSRQDHKLIDNLNHDNQRLQQETSKFRRLSTVDPLTQLFNRFGLDQIVTSLTKTALVEPIDPVPHMALILLDIDHFKVINDTYGHDVGDIVLRETAELIKKNALDNEFIGRWGGEEFLILLPATTAERARLLAEDLRQKIARNTIATPAAEITITASFGVGECTDHDFPSAFKRVDLALYEAKHHGRNKVTLATNKE
jgi:diguanylate cyclase (GGDEF)-like protein